MKPLELVAQLLRVAGLAFLISVPAALAIAWLLTELYRRSLRRQMRESAAESAKRAVANALHASPSRAPRPAATSSSPPSSRRSSAQELATASERWLRRSLRAALSLSLAGLVHASTTSLLECYFAQGEFTPAGVLRTTLVQLGPFVLLFCVFFAASAAAVALAATIYVAAIAASGMVSPHWFDPWIGLTVALLPLGFSSVFWSKPIRGVGLLSWAMALVLLGTASSSMTWLELHMPGAAELALELGLTAPATVALILLLGAPATTLVAWPLLRSLGKLCRARRLSDQGLIDDLLVFACSVFNAIEFTRASNSLTRCVLALAPFLAYCLVIRLANARLGAEMRGARPLRLLYLRALVTGPEPGRVLHALARSWCHAGSVSVLGGADLIASPPPLRAFLDFLSGRLRYRFADDLAGVGQAIAAFEERPDFQGRFAINELYCREGTWKRALARMAVRSDVILIDLRGFTRKRAGARFELAELAAAGQLRRSLLMVDATTDQALISEAIDSARKSGDGSPSTVSFPNGRIRLPLLMDALLHAAGAERFDAEPFMQSARRSRTS